tara:strand:+ start:397 stop:795 length:399 start_codon:yes stop_codon:yes gene_type:complete
MIEYDSSGLIKNIFQVVVMNNGATEAELEEQLDYDPEEIVSQLKDLYYDGAIFWDDLGTDAYWDSEKAEMLEESRSAYPYQEHTKTWFMRPLQGIHIFTDEQVKDPRSIPYYVYLQREASTLMAMIEEDTVK